MFFLKQCGDSAAYSNLFYTFVFSLPSGKMPYSRLLSGHYLYEVSHPTPSKIHIYMIKKIEINFLLEDW